MPDTKYLNPQQISKLLHDMTPVKKAKKKKKLLEKIIKPKKIKLERKILNYRQYKSLNHQNAYMESFIIDFYLKHIKEKPEVTDMVWLLSNFHTQEIQLGNWIESTNFLEDMHSFELFHSNKSKFLLLPIFEGQHVFSVIVHIKPSCKNVEIFWFDSLSKPQSEPVAIPAIEEFVKQSASLFGGLCNDLINVSTHYLKSPNQKPKSNLCWAYCLQTFITFFHSPLDTFEKI